MTQKSRRDKKKKRTKLCEITTNVLLLTLMSVSLGFEIFIYGQQRNKSVAKTDDVLLMNSKVESGISFVQFKCAESQKDTKIVLQHLCRKEKR